MRNNKVRLLLKANQHFNCKVNNSLVRSQYQKNDPGKKPEGIINLKGYADISKITIHLMAVITIVCKV